MNSNILYDDGCLTFSNIKYFNILPCKKIYKLVERSNVYVVVGNNEVNIDKSLSYGLCEVKKFVNNISVSIQVFWIISSNSVGAIFSNYFCFFNSMKLVRRTVQNLFTFVCEKRTVLSVNISCNTQFWNN